MPILLTFIAFWSTRGGGGIQTFWAWDVLEMALLACKKGRFLKRSRNFPPRKVEGVGEVPI